MAPKSTKSADRIIADRILDHSKKWCKEHGMDGQRLKTQKASEAALWVSRKYKGDFLRYQQLDTNDRMPFNRKWGEEYCEMVKDEDAFEKIIKRPRNNKKEKKQKKPKKEVQAELANDPVSTDDESHDDSDDSEDSDDDSDSEVEEIQHGTGKKLRIYESEEEEEEDIPVTHTVPATQLNEGDEDELQMVVAPPPTPRATPRVAPHTPLSAPRVASPRVAPTTTTTTQVTLMNAAQRVSELEQQLHDIDTECAKAVDAMVKSSSLFTKESATAIVMEKAEKRVKQLKNEIQAVLIEVQQITQNMMSFYH
jgi:hypothetical protein